MSASANPTRKSPGRLHVVAQPKAVSSKASAREESTGKHKKKSAPTGKAKGNGASISDQQRRNYVEVAAYYIAERRGFQGGSELEDWAQAEREVDGLLKENRLSS